MLYLVNLSGGLTSFWALKCCLELKGKANTWAYFADTNSEDPDLYRFLDEQERYFGITIERLKDGRTPWEVMKDEGYITLQGMAPCSTILKRERIEGVIRRQHRQGTYTRVFGYEWSEIDRMDRLAAAVAPDPVWFPLNEPPYVDKCHIVAFLAQIGIAVPRLYTLGKNVSILKDRRGGRTRPMTLKAFRERLEANPGDYDKHEWGGCGCFASAAQLRMDDLLLTAEPRRGKKMST